MRGVRQLLSWILAFALIALALHVTLHPWPNPPEGRVWLFDPPGANFLFAQLSDLSRYPIADPAGRLAAGLVLLLAVLALLLPPARRFGAGLCAIVFGALVGFHLSPWLGREIALGGGETDGGETFTLHLIGLVAALLITVVHPKRARR